MATFDINDVARRVQYTSTGQTGPFNFTFQVNASSELLVYIDDTVKTETTHYTVSLNADGTGSVTFGTATTSGELITIIGDQPLSRTTVFQVGQVNQPTTLETEFDNTLIRQQQIKEITDRSIQLKPSTGRTVTGSGTSGPLYFPYDSTVANNASKVIAYDSAGTSLELGPTTANLNTLATITSDISTVAGISSDVTSVAGNASNINTVAGISSNVTTVAGDSTNIGTVAGISSNITTVAGNSANVTTVAGISSDVTSVAGISSDVTTVAADGTDIGTVATNIASVNTTAANITGVNSFADRYRVGSADPTTSLDAGDLFFNTTSNNLKYYDSSSWNVISSTFSIDAASDTNLTSVADGAMLLYDTGTSKWIDNVMSGDATMADTGAVTIANNAITTAKINDNAITLAKMADNSVSSAEIVDNSVGAAELNVTGNGTAGQLLRSNGDGTFTWVNSPEPFQATTVSGTTHTLDLSSANYFNGGTTTGNTTLAFSNIPTAKTWSYDITIGGSVTANDFLTTQTDLKKISLTTLSPSSNSPTSLSMSSDGTRMYVGNNGDNYLRQYTLSTAWDVSTATYTSQYYYGGSGALQGISIDTINGLYWYAIRWSTGNANIYQGTMSTAWDISTSSVSSSAPGLYGGSGGRRNATFIKPDGTKLWVQERSSTGTAYTFIREYPLSTPWVLSSYGSPTNYDATTFGATSPTIPTGNNAQDIGFNADGSKFYYLDSQVFHIFDCSTAYDLSSSSISYDGNITMTTLDSNYNVKHFHVGGTNQKEHIFVNDNVPDEAVRYSSIGINTHTFTYPASVQNPTDIISTMDYQDKYKLEFITTDGGTNVWKTGHNKYQDN